MKTLCLLLSIFFLFSCNENKLNTGEGGFTVTPNGVNVGSFAISQFQVDVGQYTDCDLQCMRNSTLLVRVNGQAPSAFFSTQGEAPVFESAIPGIYTIDVGDLQQKIYAEDYSIGSSFPSDVLKTIDEGGNLRQFLNTLYIFDTFKNGEESANTITIDITVINELETEVLTWNQTFSFDFAGKLNDAASIPMVEPKGATSVSLYDDVANAFFDVGFEGLPLEVVATSTKPIIGPKENSFVIEPFKIKMPSNFDCDDECLNNMTLSIEIKNSEPDVILLLEGTGAEVFETTQYNDFIVEIDDLVKLIEDGSLKVKLAYPREVYEENGTNQAPQVDFNRFFDEVKDRQSTGETYVTVSTRIFARDNRMAATWFNSSWWRLNRYKEETAKIYNGSSSSDKGDEVYSNDLFYSISFDYLKFDTPISGETFFGDYLDQDQVRLCKNESSRQISLSGFTIELGEGESCDRECLESMEVLIKMTRGSQTISFQGGIPYAEMVSDFYPTGIDSQIAYIALPNLEDLVCERVLEVFPPTPTYVKPNGGVFLDNFIEKSGSTLAWRNDIKLDVSLTTRDETGNINHQWQGINTFQFERDSSSSSSAFKAYHYSFESLAKETGSYISTSYDVELIFDLTDAFTPTFDGESHFSPMPKVR